MKTKMIYLAGVILLSVACAFSQTQSGSIIPEKLPANLQLKDTVQKYLVTTDYFNGDIYGNFFNKFRVQGEYTRGLENNEVKWNDVTVAMSSERDGEYPAGNKMTYMENFTYVPSHEMMKSENFKNFTTHAAYTKNLVWDMMGIEGLAWMYFDKLELNKPLKADIFNNKYELAGMGSFENKNMILTYTGISKMNNKECALIDYRTFNNPLEFAAEDMEMKGRSHYWGTIWVSLSDKQIEYATLFEDVTANMKLPGQTNAQIIDVTREIVISKLPETK
jgi:hypothetical protein